MEGIGGMYLWTRFALKRNSGVEVVTFRICVMRARML